MKVDEEHLRHCMFYEFKKGTSAAQATRNICDVYGNDALYGRKCRRWFAKFSSGNFDLKDSPRSGRPKSIDKEALQAAVEANPKSTSRELAQQYPFFEGYVNLKSVLYHVSQFYSIGENHSSHITRHPKYKLVSERQIRDTLLFLKENGFTDEEVAESIMIIFYPRSVIASSLDKIKMEEERLKRIGFNGGCVSEKTYFFTTGTKEKRKTLQLCLYYIEKPLYFSGDGMWNYEAGDLPGYCKTQAT